MASNRAGSHGGGPDFPSLAFPNLGCTHQNRLRLHTSEQVQEFRKNYFGSYKFLSIVGNWDVIDTLPAIIKCEFAERDQN